VPSSATRPPRERGRYTGYLGAVFAVASVAGPLLGGFFVDNLTWRWVFYVNVPIGIVALVITSSVLRLPFARQDHEIDFVGAALLVAGVSTLLLGLVWGGSEYPWGSPVIVGLLGGSVVLTAVFLWWESRTPEPILPLRLFRGRVFSAKSRCRSSSAVRCSERSCSCRCFSRWPPGPPPPTPAFSCCRSWPGS
jgi:MFS family permease